MGAGVYSLCDGPALSHGPYLGTTTLCSFASVLVLSVKACLFTATADAEAQASASPARQRLHLKKSWGMPVLFLSSVVFVLGHIVIAYRTSCRARRKLFFHRVDPEAVSHHCIIYFLCINGNICCLISRRRRLCLDLLFFILYECTPVLLIKEKIYENGGQDHYQACCKLFFIYRTPAAVVMLI